MGSIPGLGKLPGRGKGNPLQYPCLENPMDREAWWATVNSVTKSQSQLSTAHTHTHTHTQHLYPSVLTDTHCSHILAIVNNAVMTMGMQIDISSRLWFYFRFYLILFPLDIYPEVWLLDQRVVIFLILLGTSILFSIVAERIYSPTNSAHWFPYFHSFNKNCHFLCFGHFGGLQNHCGWWLQPWN